MTARTAQVVRNTLETQITVAVNLDGTGQASFDTGIPFLEHMLDQICRHGLIDIDAKANGDLHIDDHHTVEDLGITLGQAVAKAIGDNKGIRRYGHAYVPLDEALSRVVIDFSGRPGLEMHVPFVKGSVGVSMCSGTCSSNSSRVSSITPRSRCTSTHCAARTRTTISKPCSRRLVVPSAWQSNSIRARSEER